MGRLKFVEALAGTKEKIPDPNGPTFVDLFAGCGGLSLGLMQAGWLGILAIEKDASAFKTLSSNLLGTGGPYAFAWPAWFPQEAACATEVLGKYVDHLTQLGPRVDMLVGGPPCQGFSSAGRRDPKDPRNELVHTYLAYIKVLRPKLILIENVRGMRLEFADKESGGARVNYADRLIAALSADYIVYARVLDLSSFGVPQARSRLFIVGLRRDVRISSELREDPFDQVERERLSFLRSKGLTAQMSAKAALSDFEVKRNGVEPCSEMNGFEQIAYREPITPFQKLLQARADRTPRDTRLANHRPEIIKRFQEIIDLCHATGRLNVSLAREAKEAYGLKKQAIRVLDPDRPAPTVTSLPDDMLHYSEPRILPVRETARLQTFPDWFTFHGQYTTGGKRRRTRSAGNATADG